MGETNQPTALPVLDYHFLQEALPKAFANVGSSTLFVGNHIIELNGPDCARGSVYFQASVDAEIFYQQLIIYQDVYERYQGTWLSFAANICSGGEKKRSRIQCDKDPPIGLNRQSAPVTPSN